MNLMIYICIYIYKIIIMHTQLQTHTHYLRKLSYYDLFKIWNIDELFFFKFKKHSNNIETVVL
jgi:hypothetical protein